MVVFSKTTSAEMSATGEIPNFSVSEEVLASVDKNDPDNEDEPVGHLEEEAKKRKERLRALRQKLLGGAEEDSAKKVDAPLPK